MKILNALACLFVFGTFNICSAKDDDQPVKKERKSAKSIEVFKGADITEGAVYRGNLQRSGVFNRTGVASLKGTKWKTSIGGKINSSPVVWKDMLYIGAGDGFYALSTADGSVKWKYPVDKQVDSSACIANGIVCFTTVNGELIALNAADGKLKWKFKGKPSPTSKASPAIAYGAVMTPLGKEMVAVGLNDGKLIWSINKNVPDEYCSLVLTPDAFYGAGVLKWGYLFCYDYETIQVKWKSCGPFQAGADTYFYKTSAVDEAGDIYINSTHGARKLSSVPQGAVPRGENKPLWITGLLDKSVDDNELIPAACPTVWNGKVYAGRDDGKMCALDAKDGKILWTKKYAASVLSDPSIAAKSGLIYFGCYDGNLYALDSASGEERWKYNTGAQIFSSPWVEDGVVYIASRSAYAST